MAEFIKLRLTAAKAGVTMAFLALLGGIATAKPGAENSQRAKAANKLDKWTPALSLNGLSANLRGVLIGLEKDLASVFYKEQKDIATLEYKEHKHIAAVLYKEHKDFSALSATLQGSYYDKHKTDATFLSQTDAAAEYLKLKDTAANSNELGGLTPSQFIQGTGGVQTNALTISGNSTSPQNLLMLKGTNGSIIVVCTPNPGGGALIQIDNTTGSLIPAIMNGAPISLDPTKPTTLATVTPNGEQLTLQTFPTSSFNEVATLTISGSEPATGGTVQIVGQMLSGNG
jgi:hypothetical protein